MGNPKIVREGYEDRLVTVEWEHEMPEHGEVVIYTHREKWHLSIDSTGRLEIRSTNLPTRPSNRIKVSPLSANLVALETTRLGE